MAHVEIAQRSTRGSFALFGGNFLSTVISFFAILFIARLLGPSNYGVYALCVLVPNILLNFLGFGVSSGITRYAAYSVSQNDTEAAKRFTLAGILFVLLFGTILSSIDLAASGLIATSIFHRPTITPFLRFSSSFIFAQAVFQSGVSALLGWSYMGRIAWTNIIQSALRLAIVVPLLLLDYAVFGALIAYFTSVFVGGLLSYFLLAKAMKGVRLSASEFVSDVRILLAYGRELFVGTLATNFAPQYVVALLAIVASNAYVGYYQSASNFTTAVTLTSGAVAQALFPAFAHLEGAGADIPRAFKYAVKYMGFAITPIIFLLMGASLQIIRLPLGSSYSAAAYFLALLALSNLSMLFGSAVLPSFFNGLGRPRYYMIHSLFGLLVLIVLAPLLGIVVGLGVTGLILSLFIANMMGLVMGLYLAARFLSSRVDYRACLSILGSSVVAYLCVLAVSGLKTRDLVLLPAEILVFLGVYFTACPLTGAIRYEDVQILESAFLGLGRFEALVRPILKYERFVLRVARLDRERASA